MSNMNNLKPQVNSRFITNINNTNYTKNTNNFTNNTNFKICEITNAKEVLATPSGISGVASLSRPSGSPLPSAPDSQVAGEGISGGAQSQTSQLPNIWRGLKIDLIDNAAQGSNRRSLKIKFGIIRKDSTTQSILANLNSPNSYLWRKVPDTEYNSFHWQSVRMIQDQFNDLGISYRVSKCVLPHNSGTTEIVAFLSEDQDTWAIILVREGSQYQFFIDKSAPVTAAQRAGNIIASKFIGQESRPLLTCKELGI